MSENPKMEVSWFHHVAMLIACCFTSLFIGSHLASTSFSLIPDTIFLLIGCMFTVVWGYYARLGLSKIPLILIGIYLGSTFNIFLSVDFLANPSYSIVLIDFVVIGIGLALILKMIKKPFGKIGSAFLFEKMRYVFLGVSLISLLFALSVFVYLVQTYLPLLAQVKGTGIRIEQDPSLVINIFKSLFLTGLFSFLERLLRIVEETKPK